MRKIAAKRLIACFIACLVVVGFTSCTVKHTHHHHKTVVKTKKLPPGHAKKISGDKSARRHAPGHRK